MNRVSAKLMNELVDANLANAAGASHIVSELEGIATEALEFWYREIRAVDFVPVNTTVPAGVTEWSYRVHQKYGKGKFVDDNGGDMPYANFSEKKYTYDLSVAGSGYKVTREEIRNSAYYGRPIERDKSQAAIFASAMHVDQIVFLGDPERNFYGLTNQPSENILTDFTVPFGDWNDPSPPTGTPEDNMRADIQATISEMITLTNEIHGTSRLRQLVLALPSDRYDLLAATPTGDNRDKTLMTALRVQNPYTNRTGNMLQFASLKELETAGAGGDHRMVLYERDISILEVAMPLAFSFLPPQFTDYMIKVPGEYKVSGVNIKRPGGILYADGI